MDTTRKMQLYSHSRSISDDQTINALQCKPWNIVRNRLQKTHYHLVRLRLIHQKASGPTWILQLSKPRYAISVCFRVAMILQIDYCYIFPVTFEPPSLGRLHLWIALLSSYSSTDSNVFTVWWFGRKHLDDGFHFWKGLEANIKCFLRSARMPYSRYRCAENFWRGINSSAELHSISILLRYNSWFDLCNSVDDEIESAASSCI